MRPPLVQPAKGAPIVHTEEEVLGNAEYAAPPDPDFLGRQSLSWCAGGGWSVLLGPGAILVLALLAPLVFVGLMLMVAWVGGVSLGLLLPSS
ncbi:MAG TPA: hypothetical protein VJ820_09980, partial [Propionibacteriaceae bacterium]|nr:hypothetical protein [Propionibacteriaceae bacterium]